VLFDMGLQIVRNLDVRSHARPSLEAVARDLEETVQLFVIQHDGRLICIDAVESQRPVRVAGRVGLALPPTSTASGRAILSQMTPDRRTQILGSAAVKAHKGLDRELDAVKKRGYAVQSGEGEPEVSAVSAPIIDARGLSAFAVTIALPTSRFDERTTAQIGTAAVRCAAEIALALPW
jgi:DNA-binding IclR family transcriptional regulator